MAYNFSSRGADGGDHSLVSPLIATPLPPSLRQRAMAELAMANTNVLEAAAKRLPSDIGYTFLRRPEVGLVMLEARAGNTGQRFNLGEMLITRCVLRLEEQGGCQATEGYAFLQGNRPRQAELAALFDALLQQDSWADELQNTLIIPLMQERAMQRAKVQEEIATTRVDFFTMVRGEDE